MARCPRGRHALAQLVPKLPCSKVRLVVTVGARLDLLVAIQNKLLVAFPALQQFTIQLSHGTSQKVRRRPAFVQFATSTDLLEGDEVLPVSIPALATRARRGEGTRLRCLCKSCPLRPKSEMDALLSLEKHAPLQPDAELEREDLEEQLDDGQEEIEGDGSEGPMETFDEVTLEAPGGKRDCVVDLWPFAYSAEYYKSLLSALNEKMPHHFVICSTSAHPGPAMAGQALGVSTHILFDRVKEHSRNHGEKILKDTIFDAFYKAELKKIEPGAKRVRSQDLHFVSLDAEDPQPVCFSEVVGSSTTSSWRGTFSDYPSSDFLEKAIPALLTEELGLYSVTIGKDGQGVSTLVSTKGLKEGDQVAIATCLCFPEASAAANFLNAGGNGALLGGPCFKVSNLACPGGGSARMSVFTVLVGLGRFLRDYRAGSRKFANVVVAASPGAGPNDGFLTLTVRTHNGCGIAAGSEIVADLGEDYLPASAPAGNSAKRFKGALDLWLEKHTTQPDQPEATEPEAPSAATAHGTPSVAKAEALGAKAAQPGEPSQAAAAKAGGPQASEAGSMTATAVQAGESLLQDLPTFSAKLVQKSDGTIALRPSKKQAVKVSPKSILMKLTDGTVQDVQAGATTHLFSFSKGKELLVDSSTSQVTSLADMIKAHAVSSLFNHGPFSKGVAPPTFTAKKKMGFIPKDAAVFEKIVKGVAASGKAQLMWVGIAKDDKITPRALALVTTKQIVSKGPDEPL